jgi:hypothetical protein
MRPKPTPPMLLLQLLAAGNCIDGSVCGAGSAYSSCKTATSASQALSSDAAVSSSQFSTAHLVLIPGNYTVLLRADAPTGCGGSSIDCNRYGSLAFKVESGRCTKRARANYPTATCRQRAKSCPAL